MFFTGLRWSGLALLASGVCAFWYVGAAWLAGAFHTGGKLGQVPPGKPAAFICEAAFHTDIALPLDGEIINWRKELRGYIPDYFAARHLSPVRLGRFGLLHESSVSGRSHDRPGAFRPRGHETRSPCASCPSTDRDVREVCEPLPGGQAAKRVLIDEILGSLKRDSEGAYRQIDTTVPGELLLLAKGRYSPFNTCNQWTASALGKAGLPRALFAPFAWSVTKPLKNTNRKEETDG
jgi:hypothetical protein